MLGEWISLKAFSPEVYLLLLLMILIFYLRSDSIASIELSCISPQVALSGALRQKVSRLIVYALLLPFKPLASCLLL
jgi:hypothetical protein